MNDSQSAMRERLDNARRTAVRCEVGSLSKSDFLARMSHELRTPMNSMMGMLRLLLDSELDERQRGYANSALKASESMLELVREITDFPLHDARELRLREQRFDLFELGREIIKFLSGRAATKKISLQYSFAEGTPTALLGDPEKLAQVLANFIHNGIAFTDKGSVKLDVRCLDAGAELPEFEFKISDTGSGISIAKQKVFFDFTEALIANSEHADVSLELAVCREIVMAMNGRIELESQPGQGTVFTITVPLAMAGETELEESAVPAPVSNGKQGVQTKICDGLRILVAEDDPINRSLAIAFIEKLGGNVDTAANGRIALEKSQANRYDLIFMDCQMPEMDGFDASRAIRDAELGCQYKVPIVAMTAFAMEGDRERCLAAGMDDHVAKPVTIDTLRRIVRKHVIPEEL